MIEHEKSLREYANFLTRDPNDSKDLVQDTYLQALMKCDKFHGGNKCGWMLVIMRHIFFNQYRQKRNHRKKMENIAFDYSMQPEVFDNEVINDEIQMVKDVRSWVDELNPLHRDTMHMYLDGYSDKDMSDMWSVPRVTIRSRIFCAKNKMRKIA